MLADERRFRGVALVQGAGGDRLRLRLPPGVKVFDNAVEFDGTQIFVEIVIHLHGRRACAGADAFHFFEGEDAVGGGFLVADLQALLGALEEFIAAAEHAGHIGADLNVMLAHGLAPQHRIIGEGFLDLKGVEIEAPGDLRDHFIADGAVLILRVHEHRDERAALKRITGLQFFEFRRELG